MKFLVLQHVDWEGLGLIEQCLRILNAETEIIRLFKKESIPFKKIDEKYYDAVIGLGSPSTAYVPESNPTYGEEFNMHKRIMALRIPSFNICYSMQLFTVANGGLVAKNSKGKEVGCHDMYLTEDGKLDPVVGELGNFRMLQWHGDIVPQLPANSKSLAYSEKTTNQIAVVDNIHYLLQSDGQAATSDMVALWLEKDGEWACKDTNLNAHELKLEIKEKSEYYSNVFRKTFLNFANKIVKKQKPR